MSSAGQSPRIVYIQYTNPGAYPPLVHSSRILAGRGWHVLFLGTGARGANELTIPEHPNIQCKQKAFCPPGWRQKLHYVWFSFWCLFWVFRWKPDWIYASDLWSCLPAVLIQWLLRVPLVYHEHDSPAATAPRGFIRLTYWARRQCARVANFCILPNAQRAKWFQAETQAAKVQVVWNCPSLDEVPPARNSPGLVRKLLYHGSIVPERLPLTVVEALKEITQPVVLKIVGYETVGSEGYLKRMEHTAAQLGISERLEIVGALSRRETMQFCATCDVGLSLLPIRHRDANLEYMTGASNKPFDYLACGLPILVSRLPAWQELFVEPGYALACDPADPASIAAAIQYFCDHPEQVQAMGERGRQRVLAEWNYQAQFQDIVERLLEKPGMRISNPAEQSGHQSTAKKSRGRDVTYLL